MESLKFETEASALIRTYLAELTFCCKYGQKRSNEICGEGCHYTGYLGYRVKGCLSNRFPMSVRRYTQGLAWLLGDSAVTVEHLRLILPYTSAHRIQWRDEGNTDVEHGQREDAYLIHRAREAVSEVVRRYSEQSARIREALEVGGRVFDGEAVEPVEGEHPIADRAPRFVVWPKKPVPWPNSGLTCPIFTRRSRKTSDSKRGGSDREESLQ